MSTYVFVVISPATTTRPVVISVSQATRPSGSSARTASSTESEIWSATLSGCPSVTDSEVNENERAPINETLASFVGRTPPHQLTCELVQGTALEHRADLAADEVVVDVDAEREATQLPLHQARELEVRARDHRHGRQAGEYLLRHVRPREHRHRPPADERREPLAGLRNEALCQRQNRRGAGQ